MSSPPDSTSIDNLPMSNNVNVNIQEKPVQTEVNNNVNEKKIQATPQNQSAQPNINIAPGNLEPNAMDLALGGIEKANMQGMTSLPSRDIPMGTENITHDEQIQPNYLPNKNKEDYIHEQTTYESMIENNSKKEQDKDRLDMIYDELQIPILVAVLYFLFQLPIVHKKLLQYLPFIFKRDGNLSFSGYLTKSFIFGGLLYLLLKLSKQLSEL